MIRIKNIARENIKVKKHKCIIEFPNGRKGRLLSGREASIDYETYVINRNIIVLPGEPMQPETRFRVISGVELILSRGEQKAESNPDVKQKKVTTPPLIKEPAPIEEIKVEPKSEPTPEIVEADPEEEAVVDQEPEEPMVEQDEMPDLYELTHKELDALMEKMGVTAPPRANKQQKIDALSNLSG